MDASMLYPPPWWCTHVVYIPHNVCQAHTHIEMNSMNDGREQQKLVTSNKPRQFPRTLRHLGFSINILSNHLSFIILCLLLLLSRRANEAENPRQICTVFHLCLCTLPLSTKHFLLFVGSFTESIFRVKYTTASFRIERPLCGDSVWPHQLCNFFKSSRPQQ